MEREIVVKVYFIRHGQSTDNILPVFQAPTSKLTEIGKKQAAELANKVSKLQPDTIFSSPLDRAIYTANIIATETSHEVVISDYFMERITPSSVAGKNRNDKAARASRDEWKKTLMTTSPDDRFQDGENYADIVSRVDKALKLLTSVSGETIVVVTHGYFIKAVLARVMLGANLSPITLSDIEDKIVLDNSSVTTLEYRNESWGNFWQILVVNDTNAILSRELL